MTTPIIEVSKIEAQARTLAWSLGVILYIREGRIWDRPPGQEFDPGPGSRPMLHGDLNPNAGGKGQ